MKTVYFSAKTPKKGRQVKYGIRVYQKGQKRPKMRVSTIRETMVLRIVGAKTDRMGRRPYQKGHYQPGADALRTFVFPLLRKGYAERGGQKFPLEQTKIILYHVSGYTLVRKGRKRSHKGRETESETEKREAGEIENQRVRGGKRCHTGGNLQGVRSKRVQCKVFDEQTRRHNGRRI